MEKNSLCHFEWSSTDLARTGAFLEGLFGWKIEPWSEEYLVFRTPEGPNGGVMKVDEVVPGRSPYLYIQVDEIGPYLAKVEALGGEVDVPRTEIPKVGWYAHVLDPDRNVIGLMEDLKEE
jgi:predicted enzyme related to lactoylglutathione lyase